VCVALCFAYKAGQYLSYDYLQPMGTQITQDARPKIIDAALMLISRMGHGVSLSILFLQRRPHQQKVKLVSKNGPHAPILLHILHKLSERLVRDLPTCFEAFNDVIASSRHLKTCLVI